MKNSFVEKTFTNFLSALPNYKDCVCFSGQLREANTQIDNYNLTITKLQGIGSVYIKYCIFLLNKFDIAKDCLIFVADQIHKLEDELQRVTDAKVKKEADGKLTIIYKSEIDTSTPTVTLPLPLRSSPKLTTALTSNGDVSNDSRHDRGHINNSTLEIDSLKGIDHNFYLLSVLFFAIYIKCNFIKRLLSF